jgi:hypothetical protein
MLILKMQTLFTFLQNKLIEEVSCTEHSPLVSVPWTKYQVGQMFWRQNFCAYCVFRLWLCLHSYYGIEGATSFDRKTFDRQTFRRPNACPTQCLADLQLIGLTSLFLHHVCVDQMSVGQALFDEKAWSGIEDSCHKLLFGRCNLQNLWPVL